MSDQDHENRVYCTVHGWTQGMNHCPACWPEIKELEPKITHPLFGTSVRLSSLEERIRTLEHNSAIDILLLSALAVAVLCIIWILMEDKK